MDKLNIVALGGGQGVGKSSVSQYMRLNEGWVITPMAYNIKKLTLNFLRSSGMSDEEAIPLTYGSTEEKNKILSPLKFEGFFKRTSNWFYCKDIMMATLRSAVKHQLGDDVFEDRDRSEYLMECAIYRILRDLYLAHKLSVPR